MLELETFFTHWHAILYAALTLVAALLSGRLLSNHARGYPWLQALRVGYALSLICVLVFMLGGVEDMIWHLFFGLKINIEVLDSQTHLLLVLGAGLIVTDPWRAAWRRQAASQRLSRARGS